MYIQYSLLQLHDDTRQDNFSDRGIYLSDQANDHRARPVRLWWPYVEPCGWMDILCLTVVDWITLPAAVAAEGAGEHDPQSEEVEVLRNSRRSYSCW